MAHKKNPIKSENACGLARVVRSFMMPTWENALLWHERDLANSSAERFTLSHASILLEDVLVKTADVLTNLWVDSDRMQKNISDQKGLLMAEKVMLELVDKGVSRDEAHEILRNASMKAISEGRELQDICANDDVVASRFSQEELDFMFDPKNHIGVSGELVDEAVELSRSMVHDS
jgi:adenylosuccinate lyase